MKSPPGRAHPFALPLKIVRAHCAPVIERDAPVLSPFLRERIILEMRLGRCPAKPIEDEFIRAGENVGAVITDAERNIAHERYAALLRMRFNVAPLPMHDPLHVTKKVQTARNST